MASNHTHGQLKHIHRVYEYDLVKGQLASTQIYSSSSDLFLLQSSFGIYLATKAIHAQLHAQLHAP